MGRATVFREFDITSPKLFTPTLPLFTALRDKFIKGAMAVTVAEHACKYEL